MKSFDKSKYDANLYIKKYDIMQDRVAIDGVQTSNHKKR